MGAQIELHKLSQLANGRRKVSLDAEIRKVKRSHTAVAVKPYAGLVTPEVRVFVEVPVGSLRIILSAIIPVRSVKRFPYLVKGIIVLKIRCILAQGHRNFHIKSLIIRNIEYRRCRAVKAPCLECCLRTVRECI